MNTSWVRIPPIRERYLRARYRRFDAAVSHKHATVTASASFPSSRQTRVCLPDSGGDAAFRRRKSACSTTLTRVLALIVFVLMLGARTER